MSADAERPLRNAEKFTVFLFLFAVFFLKFDPLYIKMVQDGLDPSWKAVLAYGLDHGARFGIDVVFTGGPLSSLYTHQFSREFTYPLTLLSLAMGCFIAFTLTVLLSARGGLWVTLVACLTLGLTIVPDDTMLLSVPFLTSLYALDAAKRRSFLVAISGAFLSGIIILAKFSVVPIAVLAMLALDGIAITRKRVPCHIVGLLAGLSAGFVAAGQSYADLPAFMQASLEVSSGYSSAMSYNGRLPDLLAWLALTGVFIATLALAICKEWRKQGAGIPLLRLMLIGGYLFVSFKAGQVRHDLHTLISWSALSIAVLTAGRSFVDLPVTATKRLIILAWLLILPGHILTYSATHILPFSSMLSTPISQEFDAATDFLFRPTAWLQKLEEQNAVAMRSLASQTLVSGLNGTVDIIPSNQATLIANGLNYTPRPTVQEYTTYSPKLIERNRIFFAGKAAPDFLIMEAGSIDGRHPASVEGALWPLFFSRYEAVATSPLGLVLKRREAPIEGILGSTIEKTFESGQEISLPDTESAWMVSVDIEPTFLGRLADIFYRPPMTHIAVTYVDGSVESYRLIPGMAGGYG